VGHGRARLGMAWYGMGSRWHGWSQDGFDSRPMRGGSCADGRYVLLLCRRMVDPLVLG